jgi:hypothetical protein
VDQTEKDGIEAVQMRDDGEVKRVLLNVNSVEDPMYNEQTSCPPHEGGSKKLTQKNILPVWRWECLCRRCCS